MALAAAYSKLSLYLDRVTTASFGGLDPASTYDLYVLVGMLGNTDGNMKVSVTQTAGSGLVGIFILTSLTGPLPIRLLSSGIPIQQT